MQRFRVATTIYYGLDSLSLLKTLSGRRVLVVTDAFMASTQLMVKVREMLSGSTVRIFDRVEPNPSIDLISVGFGVLLDFEPEAIVALGGGSPIDTAKAVFKIAIEQGRRPEQGFIVIPTTSGSGSEVTSFAVVSDLKNHTKLPLTSEDMLPDIAILDPEAVVTAPAKITADTGMDACSHALEAYVAGCASDFSDALAEKSAQLIFEWLPLAYADGSDLEARERMHNASCMAGLAFENAGLGIVHSMSHALGGTFGAPHGRLNALLLPYVLEFNCGELGFGPHGLSRVAQRYARLARLIGLSGSTDRSRALGLIDAVRKLNTTLSMPRRIADLGIDRTAYLKAIPTLAETALIDFCTAGNPIPVDAKDLASLLRKVA